MKVGDPIVFAPDCWIHGQGSETLLAKVSQVKGTIIFVQPKGRYYVAQGEVGGRTIREAYQIIPRN